MAIVVYFAVRVVLDDMAARALAIFVVAAVFWTAEVLPLFATALLVVVLEVIFLATEGGFADDITRLVGLSTAIRAGSPNEGPISARAFIEPFASDIIMLFLGGFLLAAAVARHGVDVALAGRVLRPFTRRPCPSSMPQPSLRLVAPPFGVGLSGRGKFTLGVLVMAIGLG